MIKTVYRFMGNIRRKAVLVSVLLIFISFSSCVDSLNQGGSEGPPIGFQQILLNVLPAAIFGNSCEFAEIEAIFNELLTPSGATIQVELNSQDLPFELRGCITSSDVVVINGRAFIDYLGGPLVGPGFVASVNVGVTVTLPNGVKQSSFVPVTIVGVGIIEPIIGPTTITTNPSGDPMAEPVFATIQANTFGIPPGTLVSFEVTNPTCGDITDATPVIGSTLEGAAIAQYNAFDGEECTQTIIITIILASPSDKDPACDFVPVGLRTIEAFITFTQVVGPLPSPTPTPGPSPTPTPAPTQTIDVTSLNDEIEPNGTTIITATTNTGLNTDVCCDIPIQSTPPSTLDSGIPPDCGTTDINGEFFSILKGGNVVTFQNIQVRCCIDDSGLPNMMCDPGDVQNSVFVGINPSGVDPLIELDASPTSIPPLGTSTITASTNPPVAAGTNICFNIAIPSAPPSALSPPCSLATVAGQAVTGLTAGAVPTQQTVTVRGCIDVPMNNACDPTDPSNFVSVTIIPPTPTPAPTSTPAATETGNMLCANGVDDDLDTFTDCADPGCAAASACEFPEATCGDGFDNDGDGNIDCADSNCDNQSCGVGVTCDFATTTCS